MNSADWGDLRSVESSKKILKVSGKTTGKIFDMLSRP
jgi:hypothetical protein